MGKNAFGCRYQQNLIYSDLEIKEFFFFFPYITEFGDRYLHEGQRTYDSLALAV